MRFRYFDTDGTEVRLSSVDALRFRIQTGAISPETLLHDSAVGQWAPAGAHPVFRFLVEEDEQLLSPEQRELLEQSPRLAGAGDTNLPGPVAVPRSSDSETEDTVVEEEVGLAELEAILDDEPLDEPLDEPQEEADEAPRPRLATASDEVPLPDLTPPSDEAPLPELATPPDEAPLPEPRDRSGHEAGERDATESGSPAPAAVSPPAASRAAPSPVTGEKPDGESGGTVRAVGPRRARRRGVSPLLVAGAAGAVLVIGMGLVLFGSGSEAERGVSLASLSVSDLAADEGSADPGGSTPGGGESPEMRSGATAGSPDRSASSPEEEARAVEVRDVNALAEDVAAAATADLEEAMIDLRAALGVPDGPPDVWLHGRYLSDAGAHPAVRDYWHGFSTLVSTMGELEEDLYRGFVRSRVLGMRLDTATAADLSAEALARYDAFGDRRRGAYAELSELGSLALALHDTLSARSADISFEPFDGRGLSRDPVIEAVSDDPELGAHVWSRLDRIFDLLEELQGLRPVSTSRLQAALISGLRDESPPDI